MVITKVKQRVVIVSAFVIISGETLLLKRCTPSFPVKEDQIYKISKPKVVVLIPPPVELGEAPINIKIIIKKRVAFCMLPIWIVLSPAVRAVTDWKIDPYIFSDKFKLPSVSGLLDSIRSIIIKPIKISIKLIFKTSLACKERVPFFLY